MNISALNPGVSLATYNPRSVGGIMICCMLYGTLNGTYGGRIDPQDEVAGSDLAPAGGFEKNAASSGVAVDLNDTLEGTWLALGSMVPRSSPETDDRYITMFLRIS